MNVQKEHFFACSHGTLKSIKAEGKCETRRGKVGKGDAQLEMSHASQVFCHITLTLVSHLFGERDRKQAAQARQQATGDLSERPNGHSCH